MEARVLGSKMWFSVVGAELLAGVSVGEAEELSHRVVQECMVGSFRNLLPQWH